MKVRDVCAILGVAVAAGSVVFTESLVKTNDAQSHRVAEAFVAALPVAAGTQTALFQIDWRPGGRVMQGPPLVTTVAVKDGVEGIEIADSVFAARRLPPPAPGDGLVLLGRNGSYTLKVSKNIPWSRPAGRGAGYPDAYVSPETAAAIAEEWKDFVPPDMDLLAQAFTSDAGRSFDKSKILLLWAAVLTSICLLANTLFLSVEARRRDIALMRVLGMVKSSVAKMVFAHSAVLAVAGCAAGTVLAALALEGYVFFEQELFPEGSAFSWKTAAIAAACAPAVSILAALAALKSAFAVKPLEAASAAMPARRRAGMIVSFAFGFGAFVAVEVWGSSLMSAFVPSVEWPDAIVSILPAGVSAHDISKLDGIEGVRRISELQPLQVDILPLEELQRPSRNASVGGPRGARGSRGGKQHRNALLLASSFLPEFKFAEGDFESAAKAIGSGDNCVITAMMSRSRNLHLGDCLEIDLGRGESMSLKIAGVVDLNWHMVTSRGLLRGMNRMPVDTDGPVFVSFDTLAAADRRPQDFVNMTHLWLDYEKDFLARHGPFEAGRIVEKRIVDALGGAFLDDGEGNVRGNAVRLHSRDEVADGTLAHGNDIIGSMAKIPFIFIAVVSLGFIAMTIAVADARRKEFAVMRAVGATRFDLVKALCRESVCVCLAGIAAGFAFGAPAGWLFTFSTVKAMSHWGLPHGFSVPWADIAAGAAVSVAIVLVIAAPAAVAAVAKKGKDR